MKEKFQKKQTSVPLDRPAAPITDKENSDLISRRNFRFKWGATERLQTPPIRDFSPPSAYGRIRISSRALRPARRMGTDGACAWGFFARLCPLSVTFRATSPLGEPNESPRPTEPSAHNLHFRTFGSEATVSLPPGGRWIFAKQKDGRSPRANQLRTISPPRTNSISTPSGAKRP